MRWLLLFFFVLAAGWWLVDIINDNPGYATIIWGQWRLQMQSATLLLAILLSCILFYFVVRVLLGVLGLRQRLLRTQEQRLVGNAAQNLTQGLIQLAEGHWEKAENLLTQNVDYSETPLLNYLTAARAAHMQNKPEQRDELLRQAIASDGSAQVAVGVSQAEMQLSDSQLEQAHATLHNLRVIAPQNRYVLKLYAKALYRQKNWTQLLSILPELQQHGLLDSDSYTMQQLKAATLSGIFMRYAEQKRSDRLQSAWQQVPLEIKQQPDSRWLYALALQEAGDDTACAAFIVDAQQGEDGDSAIQDERLVQLYGKLRHGNWEQVMTQAQAWLDVQPDNPVNLLVLGRLYRAQHKWEQAKAYYIASINQSPDNEACLELAEILEALEDSNAAAQCYRLGLRYAVKGRGERLVLET